MPSRLNFSQCLKQKKWEAEQQQVPTRNFLIRIINLPASHLTTSPGISQNMKSRRKVSHPPCSQPIGNPTPFWPSSGKCSCLANFLMFCGGCQKGKAAWPASSSFLPGCVFLMENVFSGQLCNLPALLPCTGI